MQSDCPSPVATFESNIIHEPGSGHHLQHHSLMYNNEDDCLDSLFDSNVRQGSTDTININRHPVKHKYKILYNQYNTELIQFITWFEIKRTLLYICI